MTADDVRAQLRKACDHEGGMRAWARKNKVSAMYVSLVLDKQREPGPKVCKPLGIEIVTMTTYRRIRK